MNDAAASGGIAAETAEESVAEKPFEKYENRANNLDKTRKA